MSILEKHWISVWMAAILGGVKTDEELEEMEAAVREDERIEEAKEVGLLVVGGVVMPFSGFGLEPAGEGVEV